MSIPLEKLGVGRQAEVYAQSDTRCVKLFYESCPRYVIEDEARCMSVAASCDVGAPAYYGLIALDGRTGIVMERLYGKTLLHMSLANPESYLQYSEMLGAQLRRVHQAKPTGLPRTEDALISRIRSTDKLSSDEKDELSRAITQMPRGDRLVHMDYHADNVILTDQGLRVIDWCGTTVGDPCADAARTLLTMENSSYPPDISDEIKALIDQTRAPSRAAFLRGYQGDVDAINAWRPLIAASRLCCCPEEEAGQNLRLVKEYLNTRKVQ